jgi:hypothetical protein
MVLGKMDITLSPWYMLYATLAVGATGWRTFGLGFRSDALFAVEHFDKVVVYG